MITLRFIDGENITAPNHFQAVKQMQNVGSFKQATLYDFMNSVMKRLKTLEIIDYDNMYFLPNELGCRKFLDVLEMVKIVRIDRTIQARHNAKI